MPSRDFLEKLNTVAKKNKDVDAFIGDLIVIDGESKETGIQKAACGIGGHDRRL